MNSPLHKFVTVLCILMHVSVVLFAEFGHHHVVPGSFDGVRTLASHDCTNVERHLPIDGHPQCLVCSRVMAAVLQADFLSAINLSTLGISTSRVLHTPVLLHFLTSVTRRGPPVLFT